MSWGREAVQQPQLDDIVFPGAADFDSFETAPQHDRPDRTLNRSDTKCGDIPGSDSDSDSSSGSSSSSDDSSSHSSECSSSDGGANSSNTERLNDGATTKPPGSAAAGVVHDDSNDHFGFVFRNGADSEQVDFNVRRTGGVQKAAIRKHSCSPCPNHELQQRLISVLQGSTTNTLQVNYSASKYEGGYNTWPNMFRFLPGVPNSHIKGQRDPRTRLRVLASHFDWSDKVVLDIGCNQGSMLLQIAHPESSADYGHRPIRLGVGVDGDPLLVNCATLMSRVMKCADVSFFAWNLDEGPGEKCSDVPPCIDIDGNARVDLNPRHVFVDNFLPTRGVDCIFLLSMCQWVSVSYFLLHLPNAWALRNLNDDLVAHSYAGPKLEVTHSVLPVHGKCCHSCSLPVAVYMTVAATITNAGPCPLFRSSRQPRSTSRAT